MIKINEDSVYSPVSLFFSISLLLCVVFVTFVLLGRESLGWQLDHVLVFKQVEAEVLERSRRPL